MSRDPLREYRFATAAQWGACVAHRFDVGADGSLTPMLRLGLHATRVVPETGPVSLVAGDPYGSPLWRLEPTGGRAALRRLDDFGGVAGPFEIDGTLARSPRWIVDRDGVWAFTAEPPVVRRYDRETLQRDFTIDVPELCVSRETGDVVRARALLDIASDGRDGLWILLVAVDETFWLLHVDCNGRPRESRPMPRGVAAPEQLGSVNRGKQLVILAADGRTLFFVDVPEAAGVRRVRHIGDLAPCWTAARLTTDTRNRIAVWDEPDDHGAWTVFVLDASGDTLESLTAAVFLPREPEAAATRDVPRLLDVAVAGDVVWWATTDGLWRLDATDASTGRESTSTLLTPALQSPDTDSDRGWLRAEVDVDVPRGAVLEAEFASTSDARVVADLSRIAEDRSLAAEAKIRRIWGALDVEDGQGLTVAGPTTAGLPVAIPLFESKDRWLWLRLTVVTPPGTSPPPLRALRVVYPDATIAQYLPAVFRGPEGDPGGSLRQFVGVLETTTQRIDAQIRSLGAHVDPDTTPVEWLDYLGRWLDLPWDDALPAGAKRRVLQRAGELLDRRGTRDGLERLLDALVGPEGSARVVDLTVDHAPTAIGGGGRAGAALPMLLIGTSPTASVLGGKARLGHARLACDRGDCDPLKTIVPTLACQVEATRPVHDDLAPLLERVVTQYIPAGMKLSVRWRVLSTFMAAARQDGVEVLDAAGPALLGDDSQLGRAVLAGRARTRLDDTGLGVEFRLA